MPELASAVLLTGAKVVISHTEVPANGQYQLRAEIVDAAGALYRTITVDTALVSNGQGNLPPRSEGFYNVKVVALTGGGFALAYDDTSLSPPGGGSNVTELHIYDAAGVETGAQRYYTSGGGEPYPWQGAPKLFATVDGGVTMVVSTLSGSSLLAYDAGGARLGERLYDYQSERPPSSVVDFGAPGLAVTYKTVSGALIREVRSHDLSAGSADPVTVREGTAAGEVMIGGAGHDDIVGQAGADTLQGGLGFDRLFGGEGKDLFVLTAGSQDEVVDFTTGEDRLSLADADGQPLSGGVLTFMRASGLLIWDRDGDGAAPAQTLGVLNGVPTISAADFAPGFEPATVRILGAPALGDVSGAVARSDITYGYGKAAYSHIALDYSAGANGDGVLLTNIIDWVDGRQSALWFDLKDQYEWTNLGAEYDSQHRLEVYATYYDDGTHYLWRFDAASTEVWQRIVERYDAQNRMVTRAAVYDDGSRFEATYDVTNVQPWEYSVESYDAQNRLLGRTLFNADGSVFV